MGILKTLYTTVIDALFPLSPAEQVLSTYSQEQAYETLPRAPQVPISDATAVFTYKDERVAKLVWSIKYKKSPHAVELGGYALYQTLLKMNLSVGSVIIPIPITSKRRRERGYNQCELLVEEIRRLDTSKQFIIRNDLLIRTQHASRQTLKGRVDRLESAKGIFAVDETTETGQFRDSTIVIIDDVITTGSTMREAVETLRSAGFEKVTGLSLAH